MGELLGDQAPDVGQAVEQAGTTTSLGRPCCGSWRSAVAMACGTRPRSASSISIRPTLRAARARMNCSRRGLVRGTMIAFLSNDRISQNVL
jgi:hypothetical protein